MRRDWSHLEKWRLRKGRYSSGDGEGFGAFQVPHPVKGHLSLCVIATDGTGTIPVWEHVSVHLRDINGRQMTPGWAEMDYIKDLFWEPDETVVQYHVPKKDHINVHPNVLHLWRKPGVEFPMPEPILV